MFITACGWLFCMIAFCGLIVLATGAIYESTAIEYLIRCDPKENDGVCARYASGTWYGWHLKDTTGQKHIIRKKLFKNCAFCMLPLIWACVVVIFAI